MKTSFHKVRDYILELGYTITHENEADGIIMIQDESEGIKNLLIGCADPILIMEQFLCTLQNPSSQVYVNLLKKNRDMVHGAFVLDEAGDKLIFRDTLQLENLDQNELEASINSLSLLLSEFSNEIIKYSNQQ
ncbi:MAG: YbjN domain-containing protein [Flavobacteriales bacterium]